MNLFQRNIGSLPKRRCVIVSRTWKQEDHPEIGVYPSLIDALAGIGGSINSYDEVFVAGGEQIYNQAIKDFLYLCDKILVTKFKTDYTCDQFFDYDNVKNLPQAIDPVKTRDYTRYTFVPDVKHDEYQYLNVLKTVMDTGEIKPDDRTGVGTKSIFGAKMVFDLRDYVPILTTKRIFYDLIIKELLFFISGKTDTKILSSQGVKIWDANTKREKLQSLGLKWNEGDMGPGYSHQWRHWGAEYTGCEVDYTDKGIDQLQNLIDGIRKDPHSRRHILTAWNPLQLSQMALPPCHLLAQFNVSGDRKWLDCQLIQRSGDMFLGVPFNITSYALLTAMIAHITGLHPRTLIHIIGDTHIYNNHGEQVRRQLARHPRPFPKLSFREASRIHEIDDFTFNSFIIEGYSSWPAITAEMAV